MTRAPNFVSTAWLSARLSGDVVIMDCRPPFFHAQGHVPGAVNLPLFLIAGAESAEAISARAGQAGISRGDPLVLYDDGASPTASHVAFLLEGIGHPSVSVLDGGITKWARDGFDVDYSPVVLPAADYGSPTSIPGIAASTDEVLQALSDPATVIVDVRHPSEYLGVQHTARKNGHMPGAINIDWTNNLESTEGVPRLHSTEDLKRLYADAGVTPDKHVIVHCQSGSRSTFTWLVLKSLGYENVSNYAAGWQEWGNRPDTPVEQA